MAMEITDANFDAEVIKSKIPVLVDFWAVWCGPCKMIAPTIEEVSKLYAGKAKVGKVDVDNNPGTAAKYGVRSIPTLFIFKNGEIVEQLVGVQPIAVLKSKLDAVL